MISDPSQCGRLVVVGGPRGPALIDPPPPPHPFCHEIIRFWGIAPTQCAWPYAMRPWPPSAGVDKCPIPSTPPPSSRTSHRRKNSKPRSGPSLTFRPALEGKPPPPPRDLHRLSPDCARQGLHQAANRDLRTVLPHRRGSIDYTRGDVAALRGGRRR